MEHDINESGGLSPLLPAGGTLFRWVNHFIAPSLNPGSQVNEVKTC